MFITCLLSSSWVRYFCHIHKYVFTIFKPHQPLHIVTKGYAYNYYAHPTCPIVIEPNCTLGWVADAPKPRNSCSAPQSSTPHDAKI